MEAGVPGVLMTMAEMPPENSAELYTPISMAKPWVGSSQNVSGVRIAMAMVEVRPGSVPMSMPTHTPIRAYSMTLGAHTAWIAASQSAIGKRSFPQL